MKKLILFLCFVCSVMMSFGGVNNECQELLSDVVEININYGAVTYDPYEVVGPVFDIYLLNVDFKTEEVNYPAIRLFIEAKSKTAINGTYSPLNGYIINAYDSEYSESYLLRTDTTCSTLTIKNVDDKGNYLFVGSIVAKDGITYVFNQIVPVFASQLLGYDEDGLEYYGDLILNEDDTQILPPEGPDNPNDPDDPTDVNNVPISDSPVKIMHNNQVLIIQGENMYNTSGVLVK